MKKALVLALVLIMSLTACLAIACTPEDKPDVTTATTIEQIIADGKNNVEVTTSGVVFAKTSAGYFIYDKASLYVLGTTDAVVGDKVEVTGTSMKTGSRHFIKNAKATVKANNQTLPTATAMTVAQIAALSNEAASFSKLVSVTAVIEKSAVGYKLVDGSAHVSVDSVSDSVLKDMDGKKAELQIVTFESKTDGWTVVVTSAVAAKVDLDEIKADLFQKATPAAETYAVLDLVTSDKNNPSVVYEWSVVSGNGITITNNVATISDDLAADEAVVLQLKLSVDGKEATQNYNVTLKAVQKVAIADLETATIEAGAKIRVEGVVIARGSDNAEPANVYTILADLTSKKLVAVVGTVCEATVGDKVAVIAEYGESDWGSVNCKMLLNVAASKVVSTGNEVDFAALTTTTLETAEQYSTFYNNGNLNLIQIVKVVDPYLIYSGNTTYNFLRFGATAANAKEGLPVQTKNNILCVKLSNLTKENGLADWEGGLNVPLLNDGAVQYSGLTFYAVSLLGRPNQETWQFLIPGIDAVSLDLEAGAERALKNAVPSQIAAADDGQITLPASLPLIGAVTWTSSNSDVLDANGNYTAVAQNTQVTLTATFKIGEATHTVEIIVTLVNEAKQIATVTELAAMATGTTANVRGVVIGITPGHGGGLAKYPSVGIVISDGTTVVTLLGKGNMTVDGYTYTLDEESVKLGDIIVAEGVEANGLSASLTASSVVSVEGHQNDLTSNWFKAEAETVIDSDEDLAAFVATLKTSSATGRDYKIVKLVGTAESPISLGARNGYIINFYYNQPAYKNSTDATYYPAWHTMSIVSMMGADWAIAHTPIKDLESATYGTTTDTKAVYRYVGELYFIYEYSGSATYAYSYCSFIGAGLNITQLTEAENAKATLNGLMAEIDGETFNGYEAGSVVLPAKVGDYDITWTANLPAVYDVATGAYTKVTEDTTIEVTATFTVGEQQVSVTYSFLLTATKPVTAISLKEALETAAAAEGHTTTVECIEAVVAAVGASNNSVASGARGLVLTDGTFTAYVEGSDGDIPAVAGVEVKSGDKVRIEGEISVTYEEGKQSVISGGELKAIVSSDNAIDYTNLKVVEVANDEQMIAWAATGYHKGLAVKFTGNFNFIGTSKSTETGSRLQLNYKGSAATASAGARYDFAGEAKPSKTVALHLQGNARLLGADWYAPLNIQWGTNGSGFNFACTGTIVAVAGAYGDTIAGFTVIDAASFSLALAA